MFCSILLLNRGIGSPTPNVHKKSYVIPCIFFCEYYHSSSDFLSNFQSSRLIFHHELLTREGRVLANGCTHPSSLTIFVRLFIRTVIQIITIDTLKTIRHSISHSVWCWFLLLSSVDVGALVCRDDPKLPDDSGEVPQPHIVLGNSIFQLRDCLSA